MRRTLALLLATSLLACGDSSSDSTGDGRDANHADGDSGEVGLTCGRGTVPEGNDCVAAGVRDGSVSPASSMDAAAPGTTDASTNGDSSAMDAAHMDAAHPDATADPDASTHPDASPKPDASSGLDDGGVQDADDCHPGCWSCADMIDPDLVECHASYTGFYDVTPCGPTEQPLDLLRRCLCDLCPACISISAGNFQTCMAYRLDQLPQCAQCVREQELAGSCAQERTYCTTGIECDGSDAGALPDVTCSRAGGYEGDSDDPTCGVAFYDCTDGMRHEIDCEQDSAGSLECECSAVPGLYPFDVADLQCYHAFTSDEFGFDDCYSRAQEIGPECGITVR